jgi:purine nucleosidase
MNICERLPRLTTAALLILVSMLCVSAANAATTRKVIIDQDAFGPGGSNMQAILLLLQAQDVDVLGITVTSGDGWRDEEVSHTLRLLEIAKRTDVPVYAGAVMPLLNTPAKEKQWEAQYGRLVYKGAWTEVWPVQGVRRPPFHDAAVIPELLEGAPRSHAAPESAINFLTRKVREFPGEVSIIAAGPLTNLALAARLDPQFAANARELVFMGGSFNPVPADNAFAPEYANSPRREFNMRWDPEAASMVLHEPWKKITEVPIDPTTRTFFSKALLAEVANGSAPFAAYIKQYGEPYPMWDELAVAVWLDPSIVKRSQTLLVDVDVSPTASYGNTLSWSSGEEPHLGEQPVNVVLDVDVPRFERMTIDLLGRPSPVRTK